MFLNFTVNLKKKIISIKIAEQIRTVRVTSFPVSNKLCWLYDICIAFRQKNIVLWDPLLRFLKRTVDLVTKLVNILNWEALNTQCVVFPTLQFFWENANINKQFQIQMFLSLGTCSSRCEPVNFYVLKPIWLCSFKWRFDSIAGIYMIVFSNSPT